jgi:hypothetical protein
MRLARLFPKMSLLLAATILLPASGAAQSPVEPGQLPGRTSLYLLWHGTPTGEIRKNNAMYALWDDPEFASARASFLETFLNDAQTQKDKPQISREELTQYASLLDNAFLVGYLRRPEPHAAAQTPATKGTAMPSWNGMFFIYDRSGKEELLSKAVLRMRGTEKELPKITNLTIAGVPSLKIESKSNSTYWAEFGKYAVSASDQSVFEEIINTVNGKRGGNPLSQSPNFQEAKPLLDGGVLEFYLGFNAVQSLAMDSPGESAAQVKSMLNALK